MSQRDRSRSSRRVLFHSYHFPPIGGSGAQRPLKMARFLVELGYESLVITGAGATRDRWAPEDETLVAEIPAEVQVERVQADGEPELSTGVRRAAERWLCLRDRWAGWWADSSSELGRTIGEREQIDLIYVWMQPYASAEAGAALAASLRRPWVADLGDPWALDEMMIFPSAFHRGRALAQMRRLLGTASAIVMSTPEAVRRLLIAFPELASRPVLAIPNGFDADDFSRDVTPRADGKFRIAHTGYLHTEIGEQHRQRRRLREVLSASPPGLDILTRSHVYLVEALNRLFMSQPELADQVELHLAGVLNDADRAVASRCHVAQVRGYMTHAESIELMRTANLLFLPMQNLPPGTRATIVPGKTYEYIASRSPILAAVPDGDARDILEPVGNATVVRPDDVDGMAEAVLAELERFRTGAVREPADPQLVESFEYRSLARELAGVFDVVLDTQLAVAPARR
jgi:glycosyltransferase involved in cell wall biosynthesis